MKEETCAICPLRSSWYDHLVMQWNIRWSQTQGTLSILLGTPKAPQEHTRTEIWRAPEPRSCGVALIRIRPLFSRYRCEFGKTFLFSHTSSPKRLLSIQSQSKSIMGANYSYLVSKYHRTMSCPERTTLPILSFSKKSMTATWPPEPNFLRLPMCCHVVSCCRNIY